MHFHCNYSKQQQQCETVLIAMHFDSVLETNLSIGALMPLKLMRLTFALMSITFQFPLALYVYKIQQLLLIGSSGSWLMARGSWLVALGSWTAIYVR